MSSVIAIRLPLEEQRSQYSAVSSASIEVAEQWKAESRFLRGSASDWQPTAMAILTNIAMDCGEPDWDGDGAIPITSRTANTASRVIAVLFRALPPGLPAPHLVPEPDGDIAVSWHASDGRVVGLSVGDHGVVNFAAQLGGEGSLHGWFPLDDSNVRSFESSLRPVIDCVEKLDPNLRVLGRAA